MSDNDRIREIYLVVGDTGAALDLVPVAREMEKRKICVKWFADPNGRAKVDVLEKLGIAYSTQGPGEFEGSLPKVLLCGTSSGHAGLQVDWTNFCRGKGIPTYWFEDLWGTGEQANEDGADPDVMLTLDDLAAKIARNKRPGRKTMIVRKPTFGKMPPMEDIPAIRAETRAKLGVSEEQFLIGWGFQGNPEKMAPAHVGEIIREGLKLDDGMVVAWRPHPKHQMKDELWDKLIGSGIPYLEKAREVDLLNLYLSSNAVVVPFGATDGYKAVLRGIPTIVPIFPSGDLAMDLYDYDDYKARITSGFIGGLPPLLMDAEWWGAKSAYDVLALLRRIREDEVSARRSTIKIRAVPFMDLEKAASALLIADVIENCL